MNLEFPHMPEPEPKPESESKKKSKKKRWQDYWSVRRVD